MRESSNCLLLLEQLYLLSHTCIYLRYLLDRSILLGILQVSILYTLTFIERLFKESEENVDERDIIKLLILKGLRMLQLLFVVSVCYCLLLRYLNSAPQGKLVSILFIGEFDDRQHDTKLYRYKILCLIYVLDIFLMLLPLIIVSILADESFSSEILNRDQDERTDQIDKILESFLVNTKEKYGIMTLLGMNLFNDAFPLIRGNDNDNDTNYRRTNNYDSIVT